MYESITVMTGIFSTNYKSLSASWDSFSCSCTNIIYRSCQNSRSLSVW